MYSSSASVWLTFLSKFQSDDFCGFEKKWNDFYRLWSTVMAFIVFKFNFSGKGKYGQEANANCLWAHLMESWSHISSEEKPVWVPPSNCDVRPRKKMKNTLKAFSSQHLLAWSGDESNGEIFSSHFTAVWKSPIRERPHFECFRRRAVAISESQEERVQKKWQCPKFRIINSHLQKETNVSNEKQN